MTTTYLQKISEVASLIDKEWQRFNNGCAIFPDIVYEKTSYLDVSELGELATTLTLLDDPYIGSLQMPSNFSDLYFKLYDNGRFWVEILNWWGSDINIHDHDFSGVQFQLKGKSLNVIYAFSEAESISNLTLGNISVVSAEVWQEGDRSFIRPGRVAPHNVNHLSMPTVSMLFRTHPTQFYGPQWNYLPPLIGANYEVANTVFRKKISALRLLSRGCRATFHRAFKEVVSRQTYTENLFTMAKMIDILFERENSVLLKEFAEQGGQIEQEIVRSIAYYRAHDFITNTAKWTPGLSENDILSLSVLASCWDLEGLKDIISSLTQRGYSVDLHASMEKVKNCLSPEQNSQLEQVLQLLGLKDSSIAIFQ